MKRFRLFLLLVGITLGMLACGTDSNLPSVEDSGYDMSGVINPLNAKLDDDQDYNHDQVEAALNAYLLHFDVINEYNPERLLYQMSFVSSIKDSNDNNVDGIQIGMSLIFDELELTQAVYNEVEMLFLQMRQDIDALTDHPFWLNLYFNINHGFRFQAKNNITNQANGLSKDIYIDKPDISQSDFDHQILEISLTGEYAVYYQENIRLRTTFSDSEFTLIVYPTKEEYYVLERDNIDIEDYLNDYIDIDTYEEVDYPY